MKPFGPVKFKAFVSRRFGIAAASALILLAQFVLEPSRFYDITNLQLVLITFVYTCLSWVHFKRGDWKRTKYDSSVDKPSQTVWPLIHLSYEIALHLSMIVTINFWLLEGPLRAYAGLWSIRAPWLVIYSLIALNSLPSLLITLDWWHNSMVVSPSRSWLCLLVILSYLCFLLVLMPAKAESNQILLVSFQIMTNPLAGTIGGALLMLGTVAAQRLVVYLTEWRLSYS